MTRTELLEIIKNGESSGIEFERDTIDNRGLAKEIVAFANLAGGRLLLGVEDDGSISGITRPKLEEWVMSACRDKIRPELIPYFEIIRDVEPGKDVAVVLVDRGWSVHNLWHNNHRNQLIKDVMRDYRYLEHMGMGIPRKIIKGMLQHNGTKPDLIEDGESFTLRLWNHAAHGP